MSTSTDNEPYTTLSLEETKQTKLWKIIQRKLQEKERARNVQYFLGILARLSDERMHPSPDDKITNPHAIRDPYNYPENNSSAVYGTVAEKRVFYNKALDNHEMALCGGDKKFIPLGEPGAEFNDVEYIAGCWRCQIKCPYEITDVRDRQFVLVKKLPHVEHTKFEFYLAAAAGWSGMGRSADVANPSWIVAKYETPRGTYMAYGQTIEQARAFLGIKLYDEYQDLIHNFAFEKQK